MFAKPRDEIGHLINYLCKPPGKFAVISVDMRASRNIDFAECAAADCRNSSRCPMEGGPEVTEAIRRRQ
jgi:hypothetical protein